MCRSLSTGLSPLVLMLTLLAAGCGEGGREDKQAAGRSGERSTGRPASDSDLESADTTPASAAPGGGFASEGAPADASPADALMEVDEAAIPLLLQLDDARGPAAQQPDQPHPARGAVAGLPAGGEGDGEAAEVDAKKDAAQKPKPIRTWKRAQTTPNTSRLTVGDDDELPLRGQQASVTVDGFRARVVLDLFYYNDKGRQLEGTFQIRLPNGASLYYLAFGETVYKAREQDVPLAAFFKVDDQLRPGLSPTQITSLRQESWNEPKVARVVPREKAAHAYRETVRRRVDPALAEWSGAGVFSARVFPLAPHKLHRIVIGYDVDLTAAGDALEYTLDLPKAPSTVADVSVADLPNATVSVTPELAPIHRDGRQLYRFDDLDGDAITVRIENAGQVVLVGAEGAELPDPSAALRGKARTGTGVDAGAGYFATQFTPDLPDEEAAGGAQRAVFLLDTSLSSNPERFNVWLSLLRAILDENRETLTEFAVVGFNVECFWWREEWCANTPENVQALTEFCEELSLEGATNLGRAIGEAAQPGWEPVGDRSPRHDLFLLSDGAVTWGEGDLYALSQRLAGRTLFAYTTGLAGTDSRVLAHLARESGGAVFSVVGEAQLKQAATAHRRRPWEIVNITVEGGSDLLLAGRPTAIFPGQRLTLVGRRMISLDELFDDEVRRLGQDEATQSDDSAADRDADREFATLTVRRGEDVRQIPVRVRASLASELAPRAYGQVAVAQLEDLRDATEEFSAAYARHFRVAGQTCSLLMLDTEEDYRRYDIKPEEDALVVKQRPTANAIEKALAEAKERLGDPKAEFLAWLKKLEDMPGLEFKTPTAVRLALEDLPREAFAVEPSPLACQVRTWDGVPGALQEQLAAKNLEYDAVVAEAERRRKEHGPADALRVLSSLVELRPGDPVTARDVGFSAMEYGLGGEAYHLLRRVADIRPWEPQTYHALARCLEEMGRADLAAAYYEVALAGQWDARFGAFREIATMDYLRLLNRIERGELTTHDADFAAARRKTLAASGAGRPRDLVVMLMWNTDGTDVDMHVLEPTGEECFYSHPQTKAGGRLTQDVTQGYGPEMYTLSKAPAGRYKVWAHYFASDANRTGTRTKVYATVYEDWSRPSERVTRHVVTLRAGRQDHAIATIRR